MVDQELLTRDDIVERFGESTIAKLDDYNCDFSVRDSSARVEFTSSIMINNSLITAHYYQTLYDVETHDLDDLEWRIAGYSID